MHNKLNGQSLKIASLNVCGLKTRLEYPDFVNYFSSYESDIVSLPGFTAISQPRKEKQNRKSGGLAFSLEIIYPNTVNIAKRHQITSYGYQ